MSVYGVEGKRLTLSLRVFNPFAPSNRHANHPISYRKHENEKKREYEERILNIEHALFSPIVMLITGGLGRIATSTYKRLASLLAEKWNQAYGPTMSWLRCRLSFSLLRSSIQALRGSRSSSGCAIHSATPIDRAIFESQLTVYCLKLIIICYIFVGSSFLVYFNILVCTFVYFKFSLALYF